MERRKKEWALRHAAAEKARLAIEQAKQEAEEAQREVEKRRRQAKVELTRKAEQRGRETTVQTKSKLKHAYGGTRWRVVAGACLLAAGVAYLAYAGVLDLSGLASSVDELRGQFVGGSPDT